VLSLLLIVASGIFCVQQYREDILVREYLKANGIADGLPITWHSAKLVATIVRDDFNVDESSFISLDMTSRPFLRNDTRELLTIKEGLCGEGTRVIVVLLNSLGFDASRITLYNKHMQSAHTLISVLIDDKEHIVDSINSSLEVNRYLNEIIVGTQLFKLMEYSPDISTRRAFADSLSRDQNTLRQQSAIEKRFFEHYWLYSYEALPYSKFLSELGLNIRVFNMSRPPVFISSLAEKPNLIKAITFFFLTCVMLVAWFFLSRDSKRRKSSPQ